MGEPIDLVDCRRIETGRTVPKSIWFINDSILAGV